MECCDHLKKIAVLGLGNVGELLVISSILSGKFDEIYIYNRDSKLVNQRTKSDAKFRNLTDASVWNDTSIIKCETYEELPSDAITVICIKEGYDYRFLPPKRMREITTRKDAPLMRKIAEAYSHKNFNGEVFIVSNPIGPMANLFHHFSGINKSQIHPIGTILDTARYIKMIRKTLNNPKAIIDSMVIGEHGSSAVFLRSSSRVDGRSLNSMGLNLDEIEKETLFEGVAEIRTLGYTNAGIVASILKLIDNLSLDTVNLPFPLGIYYEDVFVELPVRKINGDVEIIWEMVNNREKELLAYSIAKLQEASRNIIADAKARQQRKIIVVDDEPGEAASLVMVLHECILDDDEINTQNDFDFIVAQNGEEFIRIVVEEPAGFDLAIVDQRMPKLTGLDALIKAREYQPEMDCVILSGKSEVADLQRMVNIDGLRFIEKPMFRPEILNLLDQPGYQVFKEMLARTQQKIA